MNIIQGRISEVEDVLDSQGKQLHEMTGMLKTLLVQNKIQQHSKQQMPHSSSAHAFNDPNIEIKEFGDTPR